MNTCSAKHTSEYRQALVPYLASQKYDLYLTLNIETESAIRNFYDSHTKRSDAFAAYEQLICDLFNRAEDQIFGQAKRKSRWGKRNCRIERAVHIERGTEKLNLHAHIAAKSVDRYQPETLIQILRTTYAKLLAEAHYKQHLERNVLASLCKQLRARTPGREYGEIAQELKSELLSTHKELRDQRVGTFSLKFLDQHYCKADIGIQDRFRNSTYNTKMVNVDWADEERSMYSLATRASFIKKAPPNRPS